MSTPDLIKSDSISALYQSVGIMTKASYATYMSPVMHAVTHHHIHKNTERTKEPRCSGGNICKNVVNLALPLHVFYLASLHTHKYFFFRN